MSYKETVNFQSLNVIQDELVSAIENSARHLEQFVENRDDTHSLQECIEGVRQITGTLDVVELEGAKLASHELLQTAMEITPGTSEGQLKRQLEAVSNTFFVLTRYLEYLRQSSHCIKGVLLTTVNQLRRARGEQPLPESYFQDFQVKALKTPPVEPLDLTNETVPSMVKRLRHMYQTGLIGMLRGKAPGPSLHLMRRAIIRMHRLAGDDKPSSGLWWLTEIVLDTMDVVKMELTPQRQYLFSRVEREMAHVEKQGLEGFTQSPPAWILKDLIHLLNLSQRSDARIKAVLNGMQIPPLPYNHETLAHEAAMLNGPSAHTIQSLAKVLQTELSSSKKILENASLTGDNLVDDVAGFREGLDRIAGILIMVGLLAPGRVLKEEISRIEQWGQEGYVVSEADINQTANVMLYIDSAVLDLENARLGDDRIEKANDLDQQELIASSQLGVATKIVVEECEAGLALVKRALSAFTESDYDNGHVRNLATTLDSVRGGMLVLNKHQASDILLRCNQFVNDTLMQKEYPAALKELLETFADAIISLEYYLNSLNIYNLESDESVLQIAEESLAALGYQTEAVES